ncbi:hypothetical protein GCM10011339_24980 [Echinicola rosea]|uniref:Uncharacterized protein n=2 Tax=Echinicola rosea TaxID=1807691 RepID=A0ABQ1V4R4_9BACT|nr:hypothetical protein GCM10011339_24980 [Echinicola rosea]
MLLVTSGDNKETEHLEIERESKIVIVYNRLNVNTKVDSLAHPKDNLFKLIRRPIYDAGAEISITHGIHSSEKIKISRSALALENVYFDEDMVNSEWSELHGNDCYIIFQDNYFTNGSLEPDFEFTAYHAKVSFIPYH